MTREEAQAQGEGEQEAEGEEEVLTVTELHSSAHFLDHPEFLCSSGAAVVGIVGVKQEISRDPAPHAIVQTNRGPPPPCLIPLQQCHTANWEERSR